MEYASTTRDPGLPVSAPLLPRLDSAHATLNQTLDTLKVIEQRLFGSAPEVTNTKLASVPGSADAFVSEIVVAANRLHHLSVAISERL